MSNERNDDDEGSVTSESTAPAPPFAAGQGASAGRWQAVVIGLCALAGLSAAVWGMQWFSRRAVLSVEADRTAAAILSGTTIYIQQVDGPARRPLRLGEQGIKAGTYRVVLSAEGIIYNNELIDLKFDPAEPFTVAAGERQMLKMTGHLRSGGEIDAAATVAD